jgi:hypothetical protein
MTAVGIDGNGSERFVSIDEKRALLRASPVGVRRDDSSCSTLRRVPETALMRWLAPGGVKSKPDPTRGSS